MFYIKLDNGMNLTITSRETIYRGDNLNQKIIYLIPSQVGEICMDEAVVYLSYIRADGTADIVLLKKMDEDYNSTYHQYTFPVTCTLTRYAGEICTWLQIYSGPARHPIIAKSGECMLHITESKNMDEYISDRNLSLIYEMQRYMEDKIEKTEEDIGSRIDRELAAKADNIIFNEQDSTIQLVSTRTVLNEDGAQTTEQTLIGDPIFVRADNNTASIVAAEINESGELVITFENGDNQNLGSVVGKDGAVYVPHVDTRRILSFTVEEKPGAIPDPVDLNPRDEWSDLGGEEIRSNYTWEDI